MTIYCDESGGLSAGAMLVAAVNLTPEGARDIHRQFRAVTGLRGELKGSRIGLAERAYAVELFARAGGRAWIATALPQHLRAAAAPGDAPSDLDVYAGLLDLAIGKWLPETGGVCADVVIDDGRYDPAILARVRGHIQQSLGHWGRASLSDSHRSDGVQIADVIANSFYNIAIQSPRAARIEAIVAPFRADGTLRTVELTQIA